MSQSNEPLYKQLSTEMRAGLKDIYQQLSSASQQNFPMAEPETRTLFREATSQLDQVLRSTEEATTNLLELIEQNQAKQEEVEILLGQIENGHISAGVLAQLKTINQKLGEDLTNATLQLSFQDLTGQRIKRVVSALNKIEDTVVNLYVTSGLIMEGAEQDPKKGAEQLKAEAADAMENFKKQRATPSELKGPSQDGMSQNVIDGMLAQLGL